MTPEDLADLQRAKTLLQKPGLAARMTGLLSIPIAKGLALIPARWSRLVGRATHGAIEKALSAAVVTLRSDRPRRAANHLHLFLVMTHHEEREDHEAKTECSGGPTSCPSCPLW